jgi:PIN domain nuclease of toxin-antitoxin system
VIVLDTHAWVWWASDPELLSKRARNAIDEAVAGRDVCVSCISAWEVALLVAKGRLELTLETHDWIGRSEALPYLRFIPVDNPIALEATRLGEAFHPNPADRMIVATARSLDAPLVTKDRRMHAFPGVEALW